MLCQVTFVPYKSLKKEKAITKEKPFHFLIYLIKEYKLNVNFSEPVEVVNGNIWAMNTNYFTNKRKLRIT